MKEQHKQDGVVINYVHICDVCGAKSKPWGYHLPPSWGVFESACPLSGEGTGETALCPDCVQKVEETLRKAGEKP